MGESKLKFKKYLAGLMLVLLVVAVIGLFKIGNFDKLAGKVKITDAHLSSAKTKLNASIYDITSDNNLTSNGYDEVNYEIKYKLTESEQPRDVIIVASLADDERYASFKRITGNNITSTLSNSNRRIEIVISNASPNTEITTNIAMLINGAPNGYTVNPRIQIKESTSETFTDIQAAAVEVSTNSLKGIVRNQDNEGIANIIVSLYQGRELVKEAYTNSEGNYLFSDLTEGNYIVKINEDIYQNINIDEVAVSGDTTLDILTERVYPFKLETHKYITKVDAYNNGNLISRSYDNVSLVNFPIANLKTLSGKVYYKIVVENTGEKEGIVSLVKDELPKFMGFNEEENIGFELKDGIIYDRNLEGITLYPGEKVEDTLVLNILDTNEARTYLNRVDINGELYEHVVYLLDGQTYKEEDVLEGEKIVRPADPIENFGGWFTDSKYTNLYNYNNPVTKDLILYGKTTQKYNVEFYDKDPETGDETLYTETEVPAGDPVDEPENHPNHTGYNFDYWCKTDNTKYLFTTPVTDNLKLITCYTIKEYDVNFYNYQDTIEKTIEVEYKHLIDQAEAPTFDETGYTFICWTTDKENCYDFTTPVTGNVDLYPKHERLKNAVVFNDENRSTTVEVPYGDLVEEIPSQGKEGHTFRCFSEDRENCFDFTTPIIKNTILYAIYDINHYTVSFVDRDPEGIEEDTPYGEPQVIEWGGTATKPEIDPTHTGYTFSEWTKSDGTTYSFDTPVTDDLVLISSYDINSYPVRFHDGSDVTTVSVEYKHKVTPITDPTKEHNIFTGWLKNDTPFDFDTLIVEETDLYSSYEEVLSPKISHTPTMWTNGNVTVTVEKNDSLVDDTGYSYLYKTQDSAYSTYENPFVITENTTIIAKSVKENVDSIVSNKEIRNIDKLNPSITLFSENSVNKNSATLNVSSLDNESGINYYEIYKDNVKIGEKHFECYNETDFDSYEECRSDLPAERVDTYTVTGLSPATTYTFKVKVFDKAGNYVLSNDLEVTTTTPQIVARLIGYNDLPLQEENYINFESLEEAFAYGSDSEDLYDCQNVQCTIQMVAGTTESVEVLDSQDLTLDLNGKIVSGVSSEYTIKNNGDFTLIDNTPENTDAGKLVNTSGTALLNKTGAILTLGEGYSDHEEIGSTVSVTRPYVYGGTVGVKVEENSYFAMYDGRIVAPKSQTPGEGAVSGRVDATEYAYEAVSNTETIDDRAHQVVTLSMLEDPEARINKSIYFSKLSTAVDSANKGSTEIKTKEDQNLMDTLGSTGIYGFEKDSSTGYLISNNNLLATQATGKLIIDLRNEANDKLLDIDFLVNLGEREESPGYLRGTPSITVNKYANYGKTTGDSVYAYYSNFYQYDNDNYGVDKKNIFKLKKGEIYVLNISYTQPNTSIAEGEQYTLGNMIIKNMTLSDEENNSDKVDITSSISVMEYGFYYDENTKTIRSNNQYATGNTTAFGYTEIDLTNKEGNYDLIVNASMESYYGPNTNSYGYVGISEDTSTNFSNKFSYYYSSYPDVHREGEQSPSYGFTTAGPNIEKISLAGGKKYYLKYKYQKYDYNSEFLPTEEEYENANCSDQLIINSIDLIKKSNESTQLDILGTEVVDDDVVPHLIDNSHGSFVLTENRTATTNNTAPSQVSYTYDTIDLTNNSKGLMLWLNYKQIVGTNNTKINMNFGSGTCSNCFLITQKANVEGQNDKYISYSGSFKIGDDTYYTFALPGGFEYEFSINVTNTSNILQEYPNIEVNAYTTNLTNVEGNYFNGIYPYSSSYPIDYYNSNVISTSTYYTSSNWRDSFIKIDLTNYGQDQLLTFNNEFYDYYYIRGYHVYITDNNRALSYEDLFENRGKENIYISEQGGGRNNSGSTSSRDYDIVLKKGQIYYLHFATKTLPTTSTTSYISGYGNWSMRLRNIRLTPITETLMTVGNQNVFTGTVDVASKPESKSTIAPRQTEEPNVISGDTTVYDFIYNSETDMYDAQNTEVGDVAAKVFKVDLTESTTDKMYVFETNDGGYGNYYTVSDTENIPPIELNTYKAGNSIVGYSSFSNGTTFILEKGKVHYIQIITYKNNSSTNQLSVRLVESNEENTTNEYDALGNEIRKFNEEVDTVQLLKNVNTTDSIDVDYSQEVILDLNGHSLSSSSQNSTINNAGNLTIMDSQSTEPISPETTIVEYFDYTGNYQDYVIPETGFYTIEAWGAQGGYAYTEDNYGGYGGYAKGEVFLEKGTTIGVIVGGKGTGKDTFTNQNTIAKGYKDGDNGKSSTTYILGAGGGSSFVMGMSGSYANNSSVARSYTFVVAAGGGGAFASKAAAADTEPQTLQIGGNADIYVNQISDSFPYGRQGSLGGGGGWYTGEAGRISTYVPSSSAPGGLSYGSSMVQGFTAEVTSETPSDEPVANTYKTGNGHVKITLTKSYNGLVTNSTGSAVYNDERATLTLKGGVYTSTKSPTYNQYIGVINNKGDLKLEGDSVIKVDRNHLIGIANEGNLTTNNDSSKILLDASSCSTNRDYNTIGLYLNSGNSTVNNIKIYGKNGVGIYTGPNATATIGASDINIGDTCNSTTYYNHNDYSALPTYNKDFNWKSQYYYYNNNSRNLRSRYDGAIYNLGTMTINNGTKLAGIVNNGKDLTIEKGTDFNDFYQDKAAAVTTINDTNATFKSFVVRAGTVNFGSNEDETFAVNSTTVPAIVNFKNGTVNTNGGSISSLYNLGTLNSVNTNYNKLYNLHTFFSSTDYKGTATITGGTISDDILVNEYDMTVDGVNVPKGIVNRRNLTVKGNANVTGIDKTAIVTEPFVLDRYNSNTYVETYTTTTSVTLGDDDGEVTGAPNITTTNGAYTITGNCGYGGRGGIYSDFEFVNGGITPNNRYKTYTLTNLVEDTEITTYPHYTNLCTFNYFDGTIKNTTITDMTDIVDIPIRDLASGYDVLYDNSNGGKVTLETIDNSARPNAFSINNTPYKSLEAAISNASNGDIIDVTGNNSFANRVIIPEGKNLTLNYLSGSKLNSYSRDALITNNGSLTVTGDGTNNLVGAVAYENNGTFNLNGSVQENNQDNYFKQSATLKNNGTATIDNVTSNGLDYIDGGTLTINDGVFHSNTIYAKNGNITLNGGYFDAETNSNYHDKRPYVTNSDIKYQDSNTKPMFNTDHSNVTFNNFDTSSDARYSNISLEQDIGKFDNNSVLTLNNSKFGGLSTKADIYTEVSTNSTINVSGGTYSKTYYVLKDGSTYNQTGGVINGKLITTGSDNDIIVTSGKILASSGIAIDLVDASSNTVTLGTKGDGTTSKVDPEITGGTYGIASEGTSTSQNELFFYDGIAKATSNPIDLFIREYETGYDLVYNRKSSPQEKYLDILPIIHNYTTGVDYYDIQLAFDEADEGDELIFLKDYTTLADTPSYVVAQNKDFTLYLSYAIVNNAYVPYKDDGTSYQEIISPTIQVNNEDIIDNETGEIITEVPFITNNGKLTVVGAAVGDAISSGSSISVATNMESVSGARLFINNENATLTLNKLTAINIKNMKTMFKNSGTMNVNQGHFETLQANIFNNLGTLNFVGDGNDTNSCYNPTYIKVHTSSDLESAYNQIISSGGNVHQLLQETIINQGTANLQYLYIDTEYAYTVILNSGTMTISNGSIEQFKSNNYNATLSIDKPIINNGTMTTTALTIMSTKGIRNNNILDFGGSIDSGFDDAITNTGKLTVSASITSGARGVYDVGYDSNITGGFLTYSETYYGTGNGTVSLSGSYQTYGLNYTGYTVNRNGYKLTRSCSNNTPTQVTVSGSLSRTVPYSINRGAVYIGSGKVANLSGGSFGFAELTSLAHFCGYYTLNGHSYYACPQPYNHAGEDGKNYTVAAIEVNDATLNMPSGGSISGVTDGSAAQDYTYGIYARNSDVTNKYYSVSSMFIESENNDVTLGTKDGNAITSPNINKILCSENYKGINFYDGSINNLDRDKLCSFNDKEDDYHIFSRDDGSSAYVLTKTNVYVIVVGKDNYTSMEDAIAAASSGDTVQLVASSSYIKPDFDVIVDKDITLDLNGYLLDVNLDIRNNATLTITDSAYIADNTRVRGRVTNVTNTSGSLIINEGIVNNTNNASSSITVNGGQVDKINTSSTATISGTGTIGTINNTGALTLNSVTVDTLNNSGSASSTVNNTVTNVNNNDTSTISLGSSADIYKLKNTSSTAMTFSAGHIQAAYNFEGDVTLAGTDFGGFTNTGTAVINSGTFTAAVNNSAHGNITINGGTIAKINNEFITRDSSGYQREYSANGNLVYPQSGHHTVMTINAGTIGAINNYGTLTIKDAEITSITNNTFTYNYNTYDTRHKYPVLTLGTKDGTVSTTNPKVNNPDGYAIVSDQESTFNYYDGLLTSTNELVIDATISDIETDYVTVANVDYDEHGDLTGTSSMILKKVTPIDTKIACVNGICYGSLQEAIDASVQNYSEETGCPNVIVGDEVYFSLELDDDLVLAPQYTVTIDLNHHNINDNGYDIPSNIILINGSRNGNNLQSSLARFLSNVFSIGDVSKDIIVTRMEDGNALDTAKTYNLYKYEDTAYLPIKVDSDGAGKYSMGKDTTDMKPIKGRLYLNNMPAGEYKLKDNYDNELEFTIYDDGSLSPNVTENIISEYGHLSASAVATLIINIQTGIIRIRYILITLLVLGVLTTLLLMKKNKSKKKETM